MDADSSLTEQEHDKSTTRARQEHDKKTRMEKNTKGNPDA